MGPTCVVLWLEPNDALYGLLGHDIGRLGSVLGTKQALTLIRERRMLTSEVPISFEMQNGVDRMARVPQRDSFFRQSFRSNALRGIGLVALATFSVALTGCASNPRVSRVASDEAVDLSGYWNDTDSRLVSEEMIADSLSRVWIDEWRGETGRKPTVIVGSIRNRSSEHINTEPFTKDLERAFVNSGRVRLVASSDERGGLRDERLDQLRNATIDTAKSMGKEIGADFMLIGGINTIIDGAGGTSVRFYQIELELVNLESNEKVWIGQKKIKKVVERSRYRL